MPPEPRPAEADWARTVGLAGAHVHDVQAVLAELTAEVFAACVERFPGAQRYRHRIASDRGVVQGQRLHVERRGFKGVVAVQWYPRAHSYRHARVAGVEVRIGGSARFEPVPPPPRLPAADPHVPGRVLGLGLALLLGVGGVRTVTLVLDHPSWFPAIDILGIAAAVLAIFGAAWLLQVSALGRWWQPRPPRPRTRVEDHASDLVRWRALGSDVGRLHVPAPHT